MKQDEMLCLLAEAITSYQEVAELIRKGNYKKAKWQLSASKIYQVSDALKEEDQKNCKHPAGEQTLSALPNFHGDGETCYKMCRWCGFRQAVYSLDKS